MINCWIVIAASSQTAERHLKIQAASSASSSVQAEFTTILLRLVVKKNSTLKLPSQQLNK